MKTENHKTGLVRINTEYEIALRNALRLWAEAVTAPSTEQRSNILAYKQKVVEEFFASTNRNLEDISAIDVEEWRLKLEELGLKPNTIYARVCFLSSFYEWAIREPLLRGYVHSNPARLARPKAPKAYQTESVKAWTDTELQAIVDVVQTKAAGGDLVGKRDYALLLFYLITGMRRQEVIALRGRNLKFNDEFITITGKVKGGDYVGREVRDPILRMALLDYLTSSNRIDVLKGDGPLWTRHDRAGKPGATLSSHSFVKNLKRYAQEAGVGDVHLHQTRHSFARIIAEETGSITDTQDALGHRNAATTRIYVQRIAVKRDKFSGHISKRIVRGGGGS